MKNNGRRFWCKFSSAAGLTLEGLQAAPLVSGVSLIAVGPAKGHSCYDKANDQMVPLFADATTLQQVMQVAQATYATGVRVNVEHWSGITECCGYLTNLRLDGNNLRGDLNLFRTYSEFDHLCEMICTISDTFGLSIDFDGEPEIIDGKGLARCSEIFSCDLVGEPAANPNGLFGANLPPHLRDTFARLFDTSQQSTPTKPMAEPTNPPANPPANPPENPPAEPKTGLTAEDVKTLLTEALTPINTAITGITTRMTAVEAALAADEATDEAPAAFKAIRKKFSAIETAMGETSQKLARRLGIEFAARAGAAPVEGAAGGGNPEGETRKPWEIPASERAAQTLEARK